MCALFGGRCDSHVFIAFEVHNTDTEEEYDIAIFESYVCSLNKAKCMTRNPDKSYIESLIWYGVYILHSVTHY